MSNIGKGTRQLYYDKKYGIGEEFSANTLIKFMFGDLVEVLILFLAELAGHTVTAKQEEVTINGVKGHIDADIDGVTVDIKSTSTHAFKKFKDGTLQDNDSFGYYDQLAGYAIARGTDGAWVAIDKQNGHLTYLHAPLDDLTALNIPERIDYLKTALDKDEVPERCYSDEEEGKSGNRALNVNCSYCSHKFRCWSDANNGLGLRVFSYASGPKFLTRVMSEPKVPELFGTKQEEEN